MRQIVVISGKGGTGKTSVLAGFAALARDPVLVDGDVDAADLHLVVQPSATQTHDFYSGHVAVIDPLRCAGCSACLAMCRFQAIRETSGRRGFSFAVDPSACEGCGVCVRFCPRGAVAFPDRLCGVWMESETRFGPMVHARLGIAGENSGKLVSALREAAKRRAAETGRDTILIDGPPGIGCPVIAAVGGASLVVVVTEPTVSGEHDLKRVLALARHFKIPAAICVNKWDIAPDIAQRIEAMARDEGAGVLGRIRYDRAATAAQERGLTVIETGAACAADIRAVWSALEDFFIKETNTC